MLRQDIGLKSPIFEAFLIDRDGSQVKVAVTYPWLPSRCSVCSKWGHNTKECASKEVVILSKEKVSMEKTVVDESVGKDCSASAKEVVYGLLQELGALPR